MSGINIPVTVTGADTAATQLGKVSTSLGGIKNASNTAGQSLTNLGRIAQDAPFGFIGIQNNINPLIESFGRLKAETGSTGGAFKALIGSLAGAGGIGLAVSVATGLLTVLSQKGFFEAGESAKKADERAKEYAQTLNNVFNSVGKEAAETLSFVAVLQNENETRERKIAAIKELNSISPETFKNLKLEEGGVVGLTEAYNNYLESLKKTAAANIFKARLEGEVAKLLKLQGQDLTINETKTRQLTNYYLDVGDAATQTSERIKNLRTTGGIGGQVAQQQQKINDLIASISQVSQAIDLSFGDKTNKSATKATKAIETVASTIAALRAKLDVLGKEEILFNVDKSKEKIKELEGTISTLFSKFKLKPDTPIIQQLKSEIDAINREITRDEGNKIIARIAIENVETRKEKIAQTIEKSQKDLAASVKPIKFPFSFVDPFAEQRKNIEEFAKQASEILTTAFSDSFVALGEFLGKALTGDAGVGGFLIGIANILGGALKELGKYIIVASKLIAGIKNALNAAFKGNPILGVIAGIALIALGTAIQNSLPKFANGVENFGGGLALVGERGPEIVRLPSGSDVIPNYRLNNLTAPAAMTYIPNVTLRGSDLVIAFNRQTATNRRNG